MMDFKSRFGLGTWQFRNAEPGSAAFSAAEAVFREALELGIRHVDTAQSYGDGVSEACVGSLAAGMEDLFLATKIRQADDVPATLSAIDLSRKRLRRDRLDLAYIHWPLRGRDLRPVMEGMETARARGWLAHVGVSNFSVAQMIEASAFTRIEALQAGYNLLWRWPELDVLPFCRERGIAVVSYSSLAQGLLAAPLRPLSEIPPDDPRLKTVYYEESVYPKVAEAVVAMADVSLASGIGLARLAAEWVLSRPGIASALVGASGPEQLRRTAGGRVSPEALETALARATGISEALRPYVPDVGNIFKHYP
jgi:myo-inositol catabolism protein IolS